jgi:ABC-2 type transport system ATP-binding protein
MPEDVVLSVAGLTKSYGDVAAVRDLSLEVRRGEVFGLLGPNGAGKTTTVQIVCGLLRPDSGTIALNGRPILQAGSQWRRSLGLCPQDLVIWESLTCFEQLEVMGRLYDVARGAARRRALELLDVFGLSEKGRRLAKTLSGGMKRRLNIALALMHEPEILILDEPQAGLDPQSRILVREYIRSLAPRTTVILTTHDMDEADRLSHRVAIVDHGRLLVLDTPENLKARIEAGDVLEVRLLDAMPERLTALQHDLPASIGQLALQPDLLRLVGGDVLGALPIVLDAVRRHEIEAGPITVRRKTLEDVFIALTGRGLRE